MSAVLDTLSRFRAGAVAGTAGKEKIASAVLAIVLGAGLIFVAGFAGADVLHSAAHDARHAAGFPCH